MARQGRRVRKQVPAGQLPRGSFQLDIGRAARKIAARVKGHGKFIPPEAKQQKNVAEGN